MSLVHSILQTNILKIVIAFECGVLRYILFPINILEMFLHVDWNPPVVNSIDWTLFGKSHTCLYKVPQLTVHVRAKIKP